MDAYHINQFGSVDGIVLRATDDSRPGSREILMRVQASSLNYRCELALDWGSSAFSVQAGRHQSLSGFGAL